MVGKAFKRTIDQNFAVKIVAVPLLNSFIAG